MSGDSVFKFTVKSKEGVEEILSIVEIIFSGFFEQENNTFETKKGDNHIEYTLPDTIFDFGGASSFFAFIATKLPFAEFSMEGTVNTYTAGESLSYKMDYADETIYINASPWYTVHQPGEFESYEDFCNSNPFRDFCTKEEYEAVCNDTFYILEYPLAGRGPAKISNSIQYDISQVVDNIFSSEE